jgi:hypothetical protein
MYELGIKADGIGLDNTFTTSNPYSFVGCGAERILHNCGYGCRFFYVRYGAESDRCQCGCRLI